MVRRREEGAGNLSNEEKLRLCTFAQENPTLSQKELSAWAQRAFDLPKAPCQATVSNILKKRPLLQSMKAAELVCKRRRVLKNPELDRALGNWVLYCLHKGLKVSGELIKKQAATFAALLLVYNNQNGGSNTANGSNANAAEMTFSNGWLAGFQDRHGIKNLRRAAPQQSAAALHVHRSHQLSGTSTPPDEVSPATSALSAPAMVPGTEFSLVELQMLVSAYDPRDVYHMDEFGLFYDMPIDQSVWTGQQQQLTTAAVPNNSHARLTIAVAVNADGSDPIEPFFVGKARRPRSFGDKLAPERGFQYDHNQKGWMNGLIFQRWMQAFNSRMRDENRSVVLLLDGASSHVTTGLELTHVRVAFLALKGTSKLQPLTNGVIKAFKRRYRRAHLVNALDREEQGKPHIFAVSQLEAMQWSKQCWAEIPPELVQLCWRQTRILGGEPLTQAEKRRGKVEDDIEDDIYKHLQWLRIANPMNLDDMLNPLGENDVHAGVAIEDFVACAIEKEFEDDVAADDADVQGQQNQQQRVSDLVALTNEEKLAHLSFTIGILREHGALEATTQELRALQRALRDAIVEQRRLSRRL
ncbi:Ars-binding protein [Globisporangium polare]